MASACGKAFQEGTDKRARGALDLKFQLVRAAGPRECGRAPNSNGDRVSASAASAAATRRRRGCRRKPGCIDCMPLSAVDLSSAPRAAGCLAQVDMRSGERGWRPRRHRCRCRPASASPGPATSYTTSSLPTIAASVNKQLSSGAKVLKRCRKSLKGVWAERLTRAAAPTGCLLTGAWVLRSARRSSHAPGLQGSAGACLTPACLRGVRPSACYCPRFA